MDEETRAIREEITETRDELGDAVEELSGRLAPRRQAERLVAERRASAVERFRTLSSTDFDAVTHQIRTALATHPRAGVGIAGVVLVLAGRRRRRR